MPTIHQGVNLVGLVSSNNHIYEVVASVDPLERIDEQHLYSNDEAPSPAQSMPREVYRDNYDVNNNASIDIGNDDGHFIVLATQP